MFLMMSDASDTPAELFAQISFKLAGVERAFKDEDPTSGLEALCDAAARLATLRNQLDPPLPGTQARTLIIAKLDDAARLLTSAERAVRMIESARGAAALLGNARDRATDAHVALAVASDMADRSRLPERERTALRSATAAAADVAVGLHDALLESAVNAARPETGDEGRSVSEVLSRIQAGYDSIAMKGFLRDAADLVAAAVACVNADDHDRPD